MKKFWITAVVIFTAITLTGCSSKEQALENNEENAISEIEEVQEIASEEPQEIEEEAIEQEETSQD